MTIANAFLGTEAPATTTVASPYSGYFRGRLVRTLGGCLCAVFVALFAKGHAMAQSDQPVEMAVAGPMSGTSFSVGIQLKVGVTAAINSLTDGTILGRAIKISTHNDNCTADIAEKLAKNIVSSRRPDVLIGHSCSAATIAAAPIYAEHKILQISPASTNPKVTEMGIKTIFRMIGRDDVQGEVAAQRISKKYSDKRLGIVHFPTSYSRGLANTAINGLKAFNIEPVIVIETIGSASSYSGEIEALVDAGVEVLYLVGGGLDSGIFMRQVRLLEASFKVLSGDTLVSKVYQETAGEAGDGVAFTFPPEAAKLSTSAPAVRAIHEMGMEPVGYTLLAYAATEVWLAAVKKANSLVADEVAASLRATSINTILGPVQFDEKGDIKTGYPAFSWYEWKEGKRVALD